MTGTLNSIENKIDGSAFFEKLRAEHPVFFDNGYHAFIVSRYEDAQTVLREPVLFSSARAIFSSYNHEDIVTGILDKKAHGRFVEVLPMTDPPEHTRVRSLVNLAFSMQRVAKIRDYIEELTNELVDAMLDDGQAEVVSALGQPLPVTVIGDLLSLPRDRWRDVIRWTRSYVTCAGNLVSDEEHARRVGEDLAEMQNFVAAQLDERRVSPGDDVLTDLLNAKSGDYEPLSEKEILAIAVAFIGAGHETSTIAITELIKTLAQNPDLVSYLRFAPDQDSTIKNFCEEFLRLNPPLNAQPRIATQDTEIAGVKIPNGSMVLVANASANRDERTFGQTANQFDPSRRNAARHMTFGGGVHVCLGNMLARAELQCVAKAIVTRMDNLRLAEPETPMSDYRPVIMDWNYHITRLEILFDKRGG